ncbi:MAG: ATP synthase F1 subunit gamma [Bacteroidales bacterium]|nr:ATP synthase F1 subunit gamma [Bacteroidales bacterium]
MANLKEIRTRITSVKSTRQITSAMKMVSAAKLRRAQDAVIQMRPYVSKLQSILTNLWESLSAEYVIPLREEREVKKALFVVITSNKGLCGAFNSSVVKEVIATLDSEPYKSLYEKDALDIYSIGKKGKDLLKSKGVKITKTLDDLYDNLDFEHVKPIGEHIINEFLNGNYDKVILFYNHFKNAGTQILTKEQYLPLVSMAEEHDGPIYSQVNRDYILEPNREHIITNLLPKLVKTMLYKALLDSHASEHGARMTAMHKATDNASDLLKQLQLDYNKARQASITNEILEIVSGAEALNG